jgi:hypothetical protein
MGRNSNIVNLPVPSIFGIIFVNLAVVLDAQTMKVKYQNEGIMSNKAKGIII